MPVEQSREVGGKVVRKQGREGRGKKRGMEEGMEGMSE